MILHRYIAKTILSSTFLVLLVLLALYSFIDFITELDDLGEGNYGLSKIFMYILLTMPERIYALIPVAALLGSVLGLGTLATQSELTAMRAAGISVGFINRAVMLVALILLMAALFVGEVLRPVAEQQALSIQNAAKTGTEGHQSEYGFWTRDGNHFNHIERIGEDGQFEGIKIYEFDDNNQLRVVTRAASGRYVNERWVLNNVVQSYLDTDGVEVRSVAHARWHSQLNPGMLNVVIVPPAFLPVWDLLEYIHYLQRNHQSVNQYQLAFWSKLMMPLSAVVMVFLAIPFIFGPLRSSPVGTRILAGTLTGIGFHLFNQSFQHLGLVFGILPWLAASLPTLMFAIIGFVMMRRVN
ncbi:putative Permease [Methylophaga frappieri]|uniref:Putative Permease n=1 Tax=Methylophaga frappieri (strain ATCC BAA-2434 / DSM 25690 / JAM7) TaxID=754477 RepID=I1YL35_METFJ|nr:LPS export ABC transporter permease LptG [Methylophaga frappieri]AFJ03628.1 putative Permease [Methylophaga frappieri]